LFFPADYHAKTADLTYEQDGIYRHLLDIAIQQPEHLRGTLPNDLTYIRRNLKRMDPRVFNRLVPPLLDRFFPLRDDGRLANPRLVREVAKAQLHHEVARSKGLKRWANHQKNNGLGLAQLPAVHMQSNKKERINLPSSQNSEPYRIRRKDEEELIAQYIEAGIEPQRLENGELLSLTAYRILNGKTP